MALTTRLPSSKVEPFYGFVETTGDALRLIQAAREGIIPRITRRLNDLERRAMIRSGAIFVFSDEESGIKRWTEGLSWSASRIVGNFLVYREVADRSNARVPTEGRRSAKRRGNVNELSPAEIAEQKLAKSLVGCLSDGTGRFKLDGLVKKTITINVDGSDHHLIAYYSQGDVRLGRLLPLTSRPDIMSVEILPELLESTKFRISPIIHDGPDGRPRYVCDAEDADLPQQINGSFLFMPQVSIPQENAPHYALRTENNVYTDVMPIIRTAHTTPAYPYQPRTSPSSSSSASSGSFDAGSALPEVNTIHDLSYFPYSFSQQFQCDGPNQGSDEVRGDTSVGAVGHDCLTLNYQSQRHSASSPVYSGEFAVGGDAAVLPYARPPFGHDVYMPSGDAQSVLSCTTSHIPQPAPKTYSSLPTTPTNSCRLQQSTSLPCIFDGKGLHAASPSTLAHHSTQSADALSTVLQVDPTALVNCFTHCPPDW